MTSELPDLDEDVSFVVDGGASTGPIPLRVIAATVTSGERASNVLVWWAGAHEWMRFDSHPDLVALLEPAVAEADESAVAVAEEQSVMTRWGMTGGDATVANEVQAFAPVEAVAAEPMELVEEQPLYVEFVDTPDVDPDEPVPSNVAAEVVQPVETKLSDLVVEQFMAAERLAAVESTPVLEQAHTEQGDVGESIDAAVSEAEDGAFSFALPSRDASVAEDDQSGRAALTGLFSGGPRDRGTGSDTPKAPSTDALDAIMAARVSLESVGARIDALTSATRRTTSPEHQEPSLVQSSNGLDDQAGEREPMLASVSSIADGQDDFESVAVETEAAVGGSWRAVGDISPTEEAPTDVARTKLEEVPAVTAVPVVDESVSRSARTALAERFEEMVRKSDSHQRRIEWVMRVDELLLSACITAIADSGFVAMDLTSRDSDHRVMFDHNSDSRQVRLELSPVDTASDHLGRHVRFGLWWGRDANDFEAAMATVEREVVGDFTPPGVLTCDADTASSLVLTRVELILAADDFVKDDYSVDRQSLDAAVAATLHALEERWHQLFD